MPYHGSHCSVICSHVCAPLGLRNDVLPQMLLRQTVTQRIELNHSNESLRAFTEREPLMKDSNKMVQIQAQLLLIPICPNADDH